MSLLYECISTVVTGIGGHGPSLQVWLYTRLYFRSLIHNYSRSSKMVGGVRKAWQHSSHEWTRGGREVVYLGSKGSMFKYVCTMLENTFATAKTNFDHTNFIWSSDRQWSAANGQPTALLPVGPPPLPPHLHCVYLTLFTWQLFPVLCLLHCFLLPCVCECK